jgi:DHA1 family tetracycline resistance protein-like MFS transporter
MSGVLTILLWLSLSLTPDAAFCAAPTRPLSGTYASRRVATVAIPRRSQRPRKRAGNVLLLSSPPPKEEDRQLQAQLRPIWACVFVQMLGVGITLATLPLFLVSLGATPSTLGRVIAGFSTAQMIGCPLLVSLSQRIGRAPVLLLCLFGAGSASLLTAFATNVPTVAAARVLAGMFASSVPVAQAAVTDLAPTDSSTSALSRVSAASALGFVVGPALVAAVTLLLTAIGVPEALHLRATYCVAAALAYSAMGIGAVAQLRGKRDTPTGAAPSSPPKSTSRAASSLLGDIRRMLPLLSVAAVVATVFVQGVATYPIFVTTFLGYSASQLAFVISAAAAVGVSTQLFLVPWLAPRTGERVACGLGLGTVGVSIAACSVVRSHPWHTLLFLVHRIGLGIADTCTAALISKSAPTPALRARYLGLSQSAQAGSRIISPIASTRLYERSLSLEAGAIGAEGALPFLAAGAFAAASAAVPAFAFAPPAASSSEASPRSPAHEDKAP